MPYAVIACTIVFFWVISLRAYLFTVLPTIAADLGLSPSAAGALIGVVSLGYCAALWSSGFLPGKCRRVIVVGMAASVIAMLGVALSPGPAALYAAAALAGLGSGVYLPLGLAIVVGVSRPGRRSRNMSFHELAATAGSFCGAAFVALALPVLTWREATAVWSLVGVLGCLAMLFLRTDPIVRPQVGSGPLLRADAMLGAAIAVFATCQLLLTGLTSALPLILVNGWGVEQGEAAAAISWTRLAGLLGIGVVGALGDRWRPATAVRVFFGVAAVATAAMAVLPFGLPFIVAAFTLTAVGTAAVILISVVVAQAFPEELRSRSLSLTNGSAGVMGLAVLPALFGVFVENGMPTAPFVVATLASLVAAALIGFLTSRQAVATASSVQATGAPDQEGAA